jgi:hypothetical protein
MSEESNAPAFSEAQVAALTELIAKTTAPIINSAVTSHLKRQPNIAEEIKKALTKEAIAPIFEELLENAPDDEDAGSGKGGSPPNRPDPAVEALKAKVAELTTTLTKQAEETKSAQEAARNEKALGALKTALGSHVRPEALDIAASHLFVAQKRITFDEQGNPLFTVRRAQYPGAAEEDVSMPLADGVHHWIKSSEGKFFAPAPGAAAGAPGAPAPRRIATGGDGMPRYDQPATTDAEKSRRASEREAAIRQRYPELK